MRKETRVSSANGCKLKAISDFDGFCNSMRMKMSEHVGAGGDYEVTSVITDDNNRSITLKLLPIPKQEKEAAK